MRRRASLVLLVLLTANCGKNIPNLTPEAQHKYTLTQVIDAIGALQMAAENAVVTVDHAGNRLLSFASARRIVQFCVDANTAIGNSPNGWYSTVKSTYDTAKSQLTPQELTQFGSYLTTFEMVLATFAQ